MNLIALVYSNTLHASVYYDFALVVGSSVNYLEAYHVVGFFLYTSHYK